MVINGMQKKRYQRNLVKLYNDSTVDNIIHGKLWYKTAHKICKDLAEKHAVNFDKVCKIMAVLSPATSWDNNIKSCDRMLHAFMNNTPYGDFTVTTYGQNKKKAWGILTGYDNLVPTESNLKIWSFYNNILNPLGKDHVTIDRHAIKVLQGDIKAGNKSITPKQYRIAEHVYKEMSTYFGMLPHELQAALWVSYKEKVGR